VPFSVQGMNSHYNECVQLLSCTINHVSLHCVVCCVLHSHFLLVISVGYKLFFILFIYLVVLYSTTTSVIQTIKALHDRIIVNLKGYGRKKLWSNFKVLFHHLPEKTEKNHDKHARIVLAEIQAKHFLNTSQRNYSLCQLTCCCPFQINSIHFIYVVLL
jgi:hypothetical protein